MERVKMQALKQFLNRGAMVRTGDEFETDPETARQLENNKVARRVEAPATAADTEFADEVTPTTNLAAMKVGELRTLADSKGIDNATTMTKQELIGAILARS